jgi:hypothetical protein
MQEFLSNAIDVAGWTEGTLRFRDKGVRDMSFDENVVGVC